MTNRQKAGVVLATRGLAHSIADTMIDAEVDALAAHVNDLGVLNYVADCNEVIDRYNARLEDSKATDEDTESEE